MTGVVMVPTRLLTTVSMAMIGLECKVTRLMPCHGRNKFVTGSIMAVMRAVTGSECKLPLVFNHVIGVRGVLWAITSVIKVVMAS